MLQPSSEAVVLPPIRNCDSLPSCAHREHESTPSESVLLSRLHNWRQLDLSELHPGKEVAFVLVSKIKIDGISTIHEN